MSSKPHPGGVAEVVKLLTEVDALHAEAEKLRPMVQRFREVETRSEMLRHELPKLLRAMDVVRGLCKGRAPSWRGLRVHSSRFADDDCRMTTVANKRAIGIPVGAIYIGRGSKWGNPASHLPSKFQTVKVSTRKAAIEHYREHLRQHPELVEAAKRELQDKVLVCYCAPLPCHGDVLARVADGGEI